MSVVFAFFAAQKKRGIAAPLWMFSQRNNPYCDSLQICGGKNRKKTIGRKGKNEKKKIIVDLYAEESKANSVQQYIY